MGDIIKFKNADFSNISVSTTQEVTEITWEDVSYTRTNNKAIAAETGTEYSSTVFFLTNKIDIAGSAKVKFRFLNWVTVEGTQSGFGCAFFDSNMQRLGGKKFPFAEKESYEEVLDVPANAKYFRTTYAQDEQTYGELYIKKGIYSTNNE